ncbi:MAG: FAD-binding protein [Devosia sp.]
MSVLVLADVDQGKLTPATARLVAAAAELGPVDVLVESAAADEAKALAGVAKVLSADLPRAADALALLLATLSEPYSHVIAAANSTGRDVIPRLAALLDLMPITDVTAILGPNRFERPVYAGNAVETVSSGQAKQLLTIRASAFAPAGAGNAAPIETVPTGNGGVAKVIAEQRAETERADLSTAQIVVSGGVPLGDKFGLIFDLADRLGAAVGATRAAVDAGFADNSLQVGQTGKIVAPDLYLGIGISGALQHIAGLNGAKAIFAVNKDPEAPLVKLADVALIGDLFVIVPALIAELDRLGVKR